MGENCGDYDVAMQYDDIIEILEVNNLLYTSFWRKSLSLGFRWKKKMIFQK